MGVVNSTCCRDFASSRHNVAMFIHYKPSLTIPRLAELDFGGECCVQSGNNKTITIIAAGLCEMVIETSKSLRVGFRRLFHTPHLWLIGTVPYHTLLWYGSQISTYMPVIMIHRKVRNKNERAPLKWVPKNY